MALREMDESSAPCYVLPKETSPEKLKEIAIKDNGSFGEWDAEALMEEWRDFDLDEFGVVRWNPENAVTGGTPAQDGNDAQPADAKPEIDPATLPAELQGIELTPEGMENLVGDDETPMDRVIITSTEFMCVELRSKVLRDNMPIFNELCGFDFMEFYKRYSVSAGYLRLNRRVKEPFIRNMKAECDKLGMRFYVSDAHFKELCCNGSCCGLPEGWNYSRGQFCQALQIAKAKGEVRYADIRKDIDSLLAFPYVKASGYNLKSSENRAHFEGMTMADYMRWLWNNPQNGQNPYKMFEGIVVPVGKDAEGNLIYKYKGGE